MDVPTAEVGYTPAMPRREDHEVHKGHVVALDPKKKTFHIPVTDFCEIRYWKSTLSAVERLRVSW